MLKSRSLSRQQQIILHSIVWMLLVLLFYSITQHPKKEIPVLLYSVYNIIIFYCSYFYIASFLFLKPQFKKALLRLILLLLVAMTIKYGTAIIFENTVLRYGEKLEKKITPFYYLLTTGIVSSFFIFLGAAIRLAINSYKQEKARKTLENEKMSAELAFLKSQINPHFLFNSLNNIYSLAYHKSDRAPEAILKLADIMRYMIQENPDKLVSLDDEITYLKNYIALQQLRFKDPLAISLEINADNFSYRIMPLLLISFLENAFKHGIATDHEHPIRILIELTNGRLHFKISNLKSLVNKDKGSGIGIENLQRRLALGYPNKHTFNILDSEKFYTSEFFVYL